MKQLLKSIVGSHVHRLNNENSDIDYKGVHVSDIREKLSIFSRVPDRISMDTVDDISYELDWFVSMCTKGNPTILEVLFSDLVEIHSPITDELKDNWKKVFNTHKYVSACLGYAKTQHHKADLKTAARQGKLATAEIRVLCQAIDFLQMGTFECRAPKEYRDLMLDWKSRGDQGVSKEELEIYSVPLQEKVKELEKTTKFDLVPDEEWIDDFIYRSYMISSSI